MIKLAYCDYIAHLIRKTLIYSPDASSPVSFPEVSHPQLDLSDAGTFLSTKKTIVCSDSNNKQYKITIEEVQHG